MSERLYTYYKFPGSRTQVLPDSPPIQSYLQNRESIRPVDFPLPKTYMEVSLDAFAHNLAALQQFTQAEKPEIIPIGKYGYMGTGGPLISNLLISNGASKIGFATSDGLRRTHKEFPNLPSLMLYPLQTYDDIAHAIQHNAELTVQSLDELQLIEQVARGMGKKAGVHVQAETGFNHYGGQMDELSAIFALAQEQNDAVTIRGISSHFATAGDNNVNAQRQFNHFIEVLRHLHDQGHCVSSVHIANSAAITQLPETWKRETYAGLMPGATPAIRPGGLLYGLYGDPDNALSLKKTVPDVVSHIAGTHDVVTGGCVGYCETFVAHKSTSIAIIPIGWGSGYLVEKTRQEANDSQNTDILINGKRSPILGLVGASSFAVENVGQGKKGDAVLLVGKDGSQEITFDEIATMNGMISTQLTTMLGKSIPQVYYEGE